MSQRSTDGGAALLDESAAWLDLVLAMGYRCLGDDQLRQAESLVERLRRFRLARCADALEQVLRLRSDPGADSALCKAIGAFAVALELTRERWELDRLDAQPRSS